MYKNKKGFTLIELLAVIVILGIVITITTTSVVKTVNTIKIKAFINTYEIMEKNIMDKLTVKNLGYNESDVTCNDVNADDTCSKKYGISSSDYIMSVIKSSDDDENDQQYTFTLIGIGKYKNIDLKSYDLDDSIIKTENPNVMITSFNSKGEYFVNEETGYTALYDTLGENSDIKLSDSAKFMVLKNKFSSVETTDEIKKYLKNNFNIENLNIDEDIKIKINSKTIVDDFCINTNDENEIIIRYEKGDEDIYYMMSTDEINKISANTCKINTGADNKENIDINET